MIKHIWNKPCLTNKEENRLKQGITKWKQGLCWETNTKGNMGQVQAVTPGEIPRLTICEVLVELEKIVSKSKTNCSDTGTSCLVQEFVEVFWLTSFGSINHHTCWKSFFSKLQKGTVCLFTNTHGSDKHILVRQKDQGSLNFQVTTWGRRRQLITICRPFKRPLRQLSLGSYVFHKRGISRNTSTSLAWWVLDLVVDTQFVVRNV